MTCAVVSFLAIVTTPFLIQDKFMTEPTVAALGGTTFRKTALRFFLATRPKFLTASVLPVLIGTAWGWQESGAFNGMVFGLALLTTVFVHATANVLNDVFDDLNGNDRVNEARISPYTGGSRFIQNGLIAVPQMFWFGVTLMVLGAAFGTALLMLTGPGVIVFGAVGVGLGILYSAPPFSLSARGLGEVTVGIAFGVLPVVGSAWLQSGQMSVDAVLLSIPISMWVAAILLINEVPDAVADASVNRKTFVVRFGLKATQVLYLVLHGVAFGAVAVAAVNGLLPLWAIALPVLMLIGAFKAAQGITAFEHDDAALRPGIETTLGLHMVGSLWMTAVLLSQAFFLG